MKDDQYDSNQPNNAIKTSNRSGTEKSAASSIQTIKKDVSGLKASYASILIYI
ncbi:hypothetical protein N7X57_13715 [Lactiplantibacillus paraplantarum]|uniref:hypothetical protein n=1 Tax=Lactiplantibacillus paraplantarum TaxID=60520 RepID=UPI000A8F6EE7|nr:hypothetical protein [Lactiplantibacillus paraplantarum]MCW1911484.1 hypothetical protein [Lactiplantibacillus paraplantarum]